MKKFLSLVLALVMTMSLVTVSAGAKDFTDGSKIQYAEAVDVMSAVKVVDGYTDGSFNPSATLSRGAAAKIICNLILGPTTAGSLVADAAPFKDVPADSTFAGYIAFCSKEGIISGYADGTFRPAATLTGYAFMKMLLGALGYDKTTEGYEGANWSINVAKRALSIDLDKNLVGDFNGTKAVTREEACLFALNTLKADVVKYDNNSTITVGDIVISTNSKAEPVAQTGYANNMGKANLQFAEKYFTNLKLTLSSDDAGRPANEWKLKNSKIGTYGFTADAIYTAQTKGETIVDDLDEAENYTFTYYVDGKNVNGSFKVVDSDASAYKFYYKSGVVQEFFLDTDRYAKIVVTNPLLAKVDEIKEDKDGRYAMIVEADNVTGTTNAISDNKFYTEELAEDDMVIVTVADGDIQTAQVVEKQTGKVTKTVSDDTVYIDGTKYTLSEAEGAYINTPKVGDDADYYLDANGYILYIDDADSTVDVSKLAYLEAAGASRGDWATLRFSDGTKKVVDAYKDYTSGDSINHYVVSYKIEKDGSYKLSAKSTADVNYYYVTGGISKNDPKITISNAPGSTKVINTTSKTAYLYKITDGSDETYETAVGYKNAIEVNATNDDTKTSIAYVLDGSKVVFAYIEIDTSVKASNTSKLKTFIAYDSGADKVVEDDDVVYYELNAIVDGEITTLKVDSIDDMSGYYMYKSLTVDSDNIVDAGKVTDKGVDGTDYYSMDAIEKADGDTITVTKTGAGSATAYALADDVTVFFVDKDCKITAKTVGAIRTDVFGGSRYAYGVFTLNDDGEINMIVIKTKA